MHARSSQVAWFLSSALVALGGCGSKKEVECEVHPESCSDGGFGSGAMVGDKCDESDDCAGTLRLSCLGGMCAFAGELTRGDPCTATLECGEGLYCAVEDGSHRCADAGPGAQGSRCESTAECARNLVCSYDTGIARHCVSAGSGDIGESCAGDEDCLGGLYCTLPLEGRPRICAALPVGVIPELSWSGLVCPDDAPSPVAYFEVPRKQGKDGDFYRLPFPNDARRGASGLDLSGFPSPGDLLGIGIDFVGNFVSASEKGLDGFATNPVVYFRFSRPYAHSTIGEATVLLYDIDKDSPTYGHALSRSWGKSSGNVTGYACPNWLNVRTPAGTPLRPSTTYAVILTKGVHTADGGTFARAPDFEAMLSESAPAAALGHAHEAYAPLRAFLADPMQKAVKADIVLNAAVFTTVDPQAVVKATREVVRSAPAPVAKDLTVCKAGVKSPCDDGATRACGAEDPSYVEVHGRLTLPVFQAGTAPYALSGGGFVVKNGKPVLQGMEDVCFALSLPRAAAPEGGYPLVVYAHGTGGAFTDGIRDLAKTAAAAGGAVLAIDMPLHGSRLHGDKRGPEELFFNFANPDAARDNVTQGSADLFSLAYFASSLAADANSKYGQAVKLDVSKSVWFAHSQGAIHASLAAPFEPGLGGVVLSGVGGDTSEGLVSKRAPIDLAKSLYKVFGDSSAAPEGELCPPLLDVQTGKPRTDEAGNVVKQQCVGSNHPVYGLLQAYFERADPVNFGALWATPPEAAGAKHVFMTFGVGDTYAPNSTQKAYAAASSFTQVAPELLKVSDKAPAGAPLTGNVKVGDIMLTQGFRQYAAAKGKDAHFVYLNADASKDWQRFVTALLQGVTPAIGE